MLETNPFAYPFMKTDLIVNSHRLRCLFIGTAFGVNGINNVANGMFSLRDFTG